MTESGTFLINGVEKVVISQLVKSPGMYAFESSYLKLKNKKKLIDGICTEILPNRGTLMYF
jgi:DNA-directed RNA polymerase subunit beta